MSFIFFLSFGVIITSPLNTLSGAWSGLAVFSINTSRRTVEDLFEICRNKFVLLIYRNFTHNLQMLLYVNECYMYTAMFILESITSTWR